MKSVDEIVSTAVDSSQSITTLLRQCMVLAYELKNEKLKQWVERELNGYGQGEEVPEYRRVPITAKGTFHGGFGASIENRPLPSLILDEQHRRWAETAMLTQPVAVYDSSGGKNALIYWPTNLVTFYQTKFIEGYALVSAWQEIPGGAFVSLIDVVRNRILKFALEIREELGVVGDRPASVPSEKVDAAVTNFIFGGTNVIAGVAQNFAQIASINVGKGDTSGLSAALKALGIEDNEIHELEIAISDDAHEEHHGIGRRTSGWLRKIGVGLGNTGLKLSGEVAGAIATKWI